jgi:hypothetical protein
VGAGGAQIAIWLFGSVVRLGRHFRVRDVVVMWWVAMVFAYVVWCCYEKKWWLISWTHALELQSDTRASCVRFTPAEHVFVSRRYAIAVFRLICVVLAYTSIKDARKRLHISLVSTTYSLFRLSDISALDSEVLFIVSHPSRPS